MKSVCVWLVFYVHVAAMMRWGVFCVFLSACGQQAGGVTPFAALENELRYTNQVVLWALVRGGPSSEQTSLNISQCILSCRVKGVSAHQCAVRLGNIPASIHPELRSSIFRKFERRWERDRVVLLRKLREAWLAAQEDKTRKSRVDFFRSQLDTVSDCLLQMQEVQVRGKFESAVIATMRNAGG